MSKLGVRLFHRRSFFKYQSTALASRILPSVKDLLTDDPDLPFDEIVNIVCARAELHPLEIGTVESIKIELEETHFYNEYRCLASGYMAEARIAFQGSRILWSASPYKDFSFPLAGKGSDTHMRLRTYLDEKDFQWFEDYAVRQVQAARNAVRRLDGEIVYFNVMSQPNIKQGLAERKDWIEATRENIKARQRR